MPYDNDLRTLLNIFDVTLLLLELARFARDLELLIDASELEHQRRSRRIDRRRRAREMQTAPSRRFELELLLGARCATRERAVREIVKTR